MEGPAADRHRTPFECCPRKFLVSEESGGERMSRVDLA